MFLIHFTPIISKYLPGIFFSFLPLIFSRRVNNKEVIFPHLIKMTQWLINLLIFKKWLKIYVSYELLSSVIQTYKQEFHAPEFQKDQANILTNCTKYHSAFLLTLTKTNHSACWPVKCLFFPPLSVSPFLRHRGPKVLASCHNHI